MIVVCGIPDLQNPEGNRPTQLFIDSQGITGIDNSSMLRIKGVPHMIKDHYSMSNQDVLLGAIQHCKSQALVGWAKDRHQHGLAIIEATWTAAELKSSITKINIESLSGGDIKVAHTSKVE